MANSKITALTANTTPALTDIIPIVDDPSGTPVTQKVELTYLQPLFNRSRLVFYTNTANTIVNDSTEKTMLNTVTVGSYTFAANAFATNSLVRVTVKGALNTIGVPGNITFKGKLGATTVVDSGAVALVANQTSVSYNLELDILCFTAGSSGAFLAEGYFISGDGNGTRISLTNAGNTVTVNSTISLAFNLTAQFSVADPSNSLVTRIVTAERVY